MITIPRIIGWFRRFIRARKIGVPYTRDKHWRMPTSMVFRNERCPLSAPEDQGTRIAFKDIFLDDVYGLNQIKQPIRTLLDIGAHVGFFSLCARQHFPQATIHAYEPNPALWRHLGVHSKIGSFVFFKEAVGQTNGRATLLFPGDTVFTQCAFCDAGEVQVTAFSAAIDRIAGDQKLDLLKLDCEGGEWEILADEASMSRVRWLTLEYHLVGNHSLDELYELLKRNGFGIQYCHEDGMKNGRIWAEKQDRKLLR